MALDIPHIRVSDDQQTQNLGKLKPWADGVEDTADGLATDIAGLDTRITDLEDVDLGTLFRTEAGMDFGNVSATANQAYYGRIVVPSSPTVSGVYYRVGGTQSGNVTAALYNSSGTRLANRATGTAQASANFGQAIGFDSSVALTPGVYVICLVFSSGSATFRAAYTFGASSVAGPGSGATPTTVSLPTVSVSQIPVMATY